MAPFVSFICKNRPEHSFSLDITNELPDLLLNKDIFNKGFDQFAKKYENYQIDMRSYYFQESTNYKEKAYLKQRFCVSAFQFKPIWFDSIEKSIQLTIIDETIKDVTISFTLELSPSRTNKELIDMIRREIYIEPTKFMKVLHLNRDILYNDIYLDKNQILNNFTLYVYQIDEEIKEIQFQGSAQSCIISKKESHVVDLSINLEQVEYPYYRVCRRGLNIEGKCQSSTCDLKELLQISPQGFGIKEYKWDIKNKTYCVNEKCKQPIEIISFGYYDCFFEWKGIISMEDKSVKAFIGISETKPGKYNGFSLDKFAYFLERKKWSETWNEIIDEKICQICKEIILLGDHTSFEDCSFPQRHLAHKQCFNSFKLSSEGDHKKSCFHCELSPIQFFQSNKNELVFLKDIITRMPELTNKNIYLYKDISKQIISKEI